MDFRGVVFESIFTLFRHLCSENGASFQRVFGVASVDFSEASKTKCRFGVGSVTFENSKYREKNDARGVVLASFWRGKRGHFHLGIFKS